ncbi:MAG: hypothetical protein GY811_12705 [Myxococcales bacterium]|nr:hypothetical protein [Myxococcales bacterium]
MANNRGYKRSWKNYLLDPSYQLRFTLTILAVAAGLMAPLGRWVSQKATTATEVALNQIDEIRCPDVLSAVAQGAQAPDVDSDGEDVVDLLDEQAPAEEGNEAPGNEAAETESGGDSDPITAQEPIEGEPPPLADEEDREGSERRERPAMKADLDDSEMSIVDTEVVVVGEIQERPATSEEILASKTARKVCLADVVARKESVEGRNSLITIVMLISGVVLLLGLAVYGIRTTHRVSGPLFKVGLYLKKLENNTYDTVYNLRKGDQLVEFYDHFKDAHAGVTTMQEQDRDRLKDAIKLAKDAGLADSSDEMAESIKELERLLKEKEESIVQKEA